MKRWLPAFLASIALAAPACAMEASFSWRGIPRCSKTSPAFTITAAPDGVASLRFALRDADVATFDHGGSTIPYSARVPRGAINYIGPCPPPGKMHRYIWTVDALDRSGNVLATTQVEGRYP